MQGLRRDIPFCNVPALGPGVYRRKDSAGMSRSLLYHGHACHRSCICTMGMHVIGNGLQLCIKLSADCAAFLLSCRQELRHERQQRHHILRYCIGGCRSPQHHKDHFYYCFVCCTDIIVVNHLEVLSCIFYWVPLPKRGIHRR